MKSRLLRATLFLILILGFACMVVPAFPQASPFSNTVFKAQTFTATGQTGAAIQLNGLAVTSTVGSSFASGTITVTGTSLTSVTFGLQGSGDNGANYYALPISPVAAPGSTTTTVTATANGLYQVSLAGLTHVRFVTSGTFAATNVSITLTASPNGQIAKAGGGGAGYPGVTSDGAGGLNLTGTATVGGDPASALQVATKQYVDAHTPASFSVANPAPTSTTILAALGNAAYAPVPIVLLGDSFFKCAQANCGGPGNGPANPRQREAEHLRQALQATYGSNGGGGNPLVVVMSGSPAVIDNLGWSVSGTYDTAGACPLGPSQNGLNTVVHLSSGAVATFNDSRNIPYDRGQVFYCTSAASGSLAVAVDGTNVATATAGTSTNAGITVNGYTARRLDLAPFTRSASHRVTFTSTGDTYLYMFRSTDGTSGVTVDNLGVGGSTSASVASAAQMAFVDLIPNVQASVIQYLTNDAATGMSAATFTANVTSVVNNLQALPTLPTVFLSVAPLDVVNSLYPEGPISAAIVSLCKTLNIPCVNAQTQATSVGGVTVGFGATPVSTNPLYDFGGGTWPGSGNAGVHLSGLGGQLEGALLAAAIMNPATATASAGGGYLCPATSQTCVPPYEPLELSNGSSLNATDNSVLIYANASGQAVTLPPAANSLDSTSGCAPGVLACGPSRVVTVFNSSGGNITVAPPASWDLLAGASGACANKLCTIPPQASITFSTFSLGGAQNYFPVMFSGFGGTGGGCSDTCTFTGQTTFTGGAAISSNATNGSFFNLSGSAAGVHNWGFQSDQFGHWLVGDFTNGVYGFEMQTAYGSGIGTGFLAINGGAVYGWRSDLVTNDNHGPDTALSRIAQGAIAPGNGTPGDTSGVFTGPATAPTGACSVVGWQFTRDGHAVFCNGSTWATKI